MRWAFNTHLDALYIGYALYIEMKLAEWYAEPKALELEKKNWYEVGFWMYNN